MAKHCGKFNVVTTMASGEAAVQRRYGGELVTSATTHTQIARHFVDVAADDAYRPALACESVLLDDAAMQHVGHAVRISR
jgi:hypothetical protein